MSFTNKQQLRDRITDLIQNEDPGIGLTPETIDNSIGRVVPWLSARISHYVAWATINGDGTNHRFAIAVNLPFWSDGFSRILRVEYPAGQQVPQVVPLDEVRLYPTDATATHVQFMTLTPSIGVGNVGIEYSALHSVTDVSETSSTVPANQQAGYEYVCAADALLVYAARYSHSTRPSIEADSVQQLNNARTAMDLAAAFLERASREFGVDLTDIGGGVGGASDSSAASMWANPQPSFGVWGSPVFRTRRQR